MKNNCNIIGLTGGIGSGKTTVCALFAQHNIPSLSLDEISAQVVQSNTQGLREIIKLFGTDYLDNNQQLNRKKLKQLVFSDTKAKQQLEYLLHPIIKEEVIKQLAKIKDKHSLIIVEIPLLAEKGKPDYINQVIVCDCPEKLQISRVMQRDNMNKSAVLNIMNQQANRAKRLDLADYVVHTEKSLEAIQQQVNDLLTKILK